MPDEQMIKFKCLHCNQSIEAPCELRGTVVECPGCGKNVKVPLILDIPASSLHLPTLAEQAESKSSRAEPRSNRLLSLCGIVLIVMGAYFLYGQNQQLKAIQRLVENSERPAVKWEYKVEQHEDDSETMREYLRTHPDPSGLTAASDFSGEFGLTKINPDNTVIEASRWELCAWFIEPNSHPKLILIFKRPAG
jgi:hypothetical protein